MFDNIFFVMDLLIYLFHINRDFCEPSQLVTCHFDGIGRHSRRGKVSVSSGEYFLML